MYKTLATSAVSPSPMCTPDAPAFVHRDLAFRSKLELWTTSNGPPSKSHLERYRIPTTTEAAGVHRGPPPRPELIEVMDAWSPEHAGGATGWHPRPL